MSREPLTLSNPSIYCNFRTNRLYQNSTFGHFHNEIELVQVEEGEVAFLIQDKEYTLRENQLLFINERTIHQLISKSNSAVITYLQINIEYYLRDLLSMNLLTLFTFSQDINENKFKVFDLCSPIGKIFLHIKKELSAKKKYFKIEVQGEILKMIAVMFREKLLVDNSLTSLKGLHSKLLPVLNYVDEHFTEKINLDDMCNSLKMNKYNFCKNFKRATGITFVDYLNYIRIRNAENLLINTNKTIVEIAYECGFSSVQYFDRVFVKLRTCSPKHYRKISDIDNNKQN